MRSTNSISWAWTRLPVLTALLVASASFATISEDKVIKVSATVQPGTPSITLSWPATGGSSDIQIFRKGKFAIDWDVPIATLSGGATSYVDSNVVVGTAYEYRVSQSVSGDSFPPGKFGYIYSGIDVPLVENRGKIVLVVDSSLAASVSSELTRLQEDLVGDGWTVLRHDVSPADTVANVKNIIVTDYNSDTTNVKAVFMVGHVPVPYSGNLALDGHPEHQGAWPADVFYGEMNGSWTDTSVNTTSAARTANHNVPGDGKYDNSTRSTPMELMYGRVDFSDMPAFSLTEAQLLAQYLDKDHNFRHAVTTVQKRAIIEDNLASLTEGVAQPGWRFSSLVGASNVTAGDWSSTTTDDYLLGYGDGAGTYTSVAGVAATSDFAANTYKVIFQLFFGSYFGDWDNQNNLLRAAIAGPTYGLTSAWGTRPNWHLHYMGLGEPVGIGPLVALDTFVYSTSFGGGAVHVALMGDPTLRLVYVPPASNLNAVANDPNVDLTWTASPDGSVLGYNVYRATSSAGPFTRLNGSLVAGTAYTDASPLGGSATYMVRAVRLETSSSGTYYNGSQGIFRVYPSGASPPAAPVITTNGGNGAGANYTTTNPALSLAGSTTSDTNAIRVNGSATGVTYIPGSTNWTFAKTLAEGANAFSVTALDAAGNTSPADAITVTLDTSPPAAPVITTNGGNGAGANYTTTNPALSLAGSTTSDTNAIRVNGSATGVTYIPGSTNWTFAKTLAEGANAFSVTALDAAGNTSPADAITVTLDTTPPAAPVITTNGGNGAGANYTTTNPALSLAGSTTSDTNAIRVNGSATGVTYIPGSTNWTFAKTLAEGANAFSVTALDAAGNTSPADAITVTLDTSPPAAPVITTNGGNGAGANYTTTNPALSLAGSTTSDTNAIRVNGSATGVTYIPGSTNWTFAKTLAEGANAFSVTALDAAGNTSPADAITVTLDTTALPAPVITTDGGNGAGVGFTTDTAALTLVGTSGSDTAALLVNSSAAGVTYSPGSTTWSFDGTLNEGPNTFDVTARDALGNTSTADTITVTLDTNSLPPDTDGDGIPDSTETDAGTDPFDGQSFDPNVYVDAASGDDAAGFGTMAHPWATVAYAVAVVEGKAANPLNIRVAEGVYTDLNGVGGPLMLDSYEHLLGGYEAAGWTRDTKAHVTVIDASVAAAGSPAGNVVVLDSIVDVRLDGFTVTGADSTGDSTLNGAGILCVNLDPSSVIDQCLVAGNAANSCGSGGILLIDASPSIVACTVAANFSAGFGGGLGLDGDSHPVLSDCAISGNEGVGGGGVYINQNATALITNALITGNYADGGWGGGLLLYGDTTAVNCTIAHNGASTTGGGGVVLAGGLQSFVNCSITGNTSDGIVQLESGFDPVLDHCLFDANAETDYVRLNAAAPISLTGAASINSQLAGAIDNVDGDPLYIMSPSGNWTAAPVYDVTASRTTLTDTAATFVAGALRGSRVSLSADASLQALILENTAQTVQVVGDYSSVVASGDPYRIADYHLKVDSPAADVGRDTSAPVDGAITDDYDGNARGVDGDGLGAATADGSDYDIGAFESTAAETVTITVISPNGGETLIQGAMANITWSTTGNVGANVEIVVRKGGASKIIASSTPNDGVFEWMVPTTFPIGKNFSIEISSVDYPAIVDQSDKFFSVESAPSAGGTITVISPNGGESLLSGSIVPITWSSTGVIGDSVDIVLRRGTSTTNITTSTTNDGVLDWTVPFYMEGSGYTVEITSINDPGIVDTSDSDFSILDLPPGNGTIAVISPNGGDTYLKGSTITIAWSATGGVGDSVTITLYKGNRSVAIVTSTPNDGSYDWTIPTNLPNSSNYVVEIKSASAPGILDVGDGTFTLLSP